MGGVKAWENPNFQPKIGINYSKNLKTNESINSGGMEKLKMDPFLH